MSEPAVAVAQPAAQRQATRLGSFLVGPRVIDTQQRLGKVVLSPFPDLRNRRTTVRPVLRTAHHLANRRPSRSN